MQSGEPREAITRSQTFFDKFGWVDSIVLEGVRADHVEAVLISDELLDADGLLGLSFLSRFSMRMDTAEGELDLQPR